MIILYYFMNVIFSHINHVVSQQCIVLKFVKVDIYDNI